MEQNRRAYARSVPHVTTNLWNSRNGTVRLSAVPAGLGPAIADTPGTDVPG
jgi:hypothetical protein